MPNAGPTSKSTADVQEPAHWQAALATLFASLGDCSGRRAVERIWEDQRLRWRSGQPIPAEAYLSRAELKFSTEDCIDIVYGEAIIRRELGKDPELTEFADRFPDFTDALARQWDFDDLMESFFEVFPSVSGRSRGRSLPADNSQLVSEDTLVPGSTALDSERHTATGSERKTLRMVQSGQRSVTSSQHVLETPATPTMIGRYRVIAPLGGGGQATVYRVVHPTLQKDLVAKISHWPIDPTQADRDALVAEGKLLAEINHPNVARVIDLDFHFDRPFLVMEYVRGRNLRQFASGRRLPTGQAASIVAQIARGLVPVHAVGIIHRDLKPQNIVIDEKGHPWIIDFGLALLRGCWRDDVGDIHHVSGTVPYMAPEQARGEHERISTQSDVFSLGAVLYDLLVGQPPFVGQNLRESLFKAQSCQFDKAALERAAVPRDLAAICLKAMALEPADRHENAEALAKELEAYLQPPARSRMLWIGAALAGLLVAISGLLVMVSRSPEPKPVPAPPSVVIPESPVIPEPLIAGPLLDIRAWSARSAKPSRFRDLVDAVPLIKGDELTARCDVPAGFHAALYGLTSGGELQLLASVPSASESQILRFPAQESQAAPVGGPPATQLLLVCLSRNQAVAAEKLKALGARLHAKWPMISAKTILRATPAGVEAVVESRDFEAPTTREDPDTMIREQLEELRKQLQTELDYFEALTFAFSG